MENDACTLRKDLAALLRGWLDASLSCEEEDRLMAAVDAACPDGVVPGNLFPGDEASADILRLYIDLRFSARDVLFSNVTDPDRPDSDRLFEEMERDAFAFIDSLAKKEAPKRRRFPLAARLATAAAACAACVAVWFAIPSVDDGKHTPVACATHPDSVATARPIPDSISVALPVQTQMTAEARTPATAKPAAKRRLRSTEHAAVSEAYADEGCWNALADMCREMSDVINPETDMAMLHDNEISRGVYAGLAEAEAFLNDLR